MIPSNFHCLYDEKAISKAVARIASPITTWAKEVWDDSHTDILAMPILRGGIFFFADLVREINSSVEVSIARVTSYEVGKNAKQSMEVKIDIKDAPVRGRRVLLIDDICDTGRTLKVLKENLVSLGASEVRSCVLIKRAIPNPIFEPDWVGFSYTGDEWFVGYGMEDGNRWSNLPKVYIIKKSNF